MTMADVWKLETIDQDWASDDLNCIIACALNEDGLQGRAFTFGDRMNAIKYLRSLWDNESWKSIKEKLQVEGSTWIVWYMDGVNAHLVNLKKQQAEDEATEMIEAAKQWNDLNINLRSGEVAIILNALSQAEEKAHSIIVKTATHDLISRIESIENRS